MKLRSISGNLSIASLFGIVLAWGYIPKFEAWHGYTLLGISLVSFILWIILSLDVIAGWLKQRSTQFYLALLITAIASVAVVGVLNWGAVTYNKKWDLTANKLHSLSDQTLKIASELKEEVVLRVWTKSVEQMSQNVDMKRFLSNYEIAGKGKIKLEIKNPNEAVIDAKTDNIKRQDVIIVRAGSGREARIENFNDSKGEEQLTNAIVQAVKGSKKVICFLGGHGQLSLTGTDAEGLSTVRERLNDSSYEAKEVTLANSERVPSECEALINVGPRGDVPESELKVLSRYLAEGGKMMSLTGPGTGPGWKKLLAEYGVDIQSDLIVEPRNQPPVAIATRNFSQDIEITKNSSAIVLFIEASTLKLPTSNSFNGAEVKVFISSEASAVSKTGPLKTMADVLPKVGDRRGPHPLAAVVSKVIENEASPTAPSTPPNATKPAAPKTEAIPQKSGSVDWYSKLISVAHAQEAEAPELTPVDGEPKDGPKEVKKEMTLIVFGNNNFAANGVVRQGGNMDLFLNSVSYMLKDQELIGIRPRDIKSATLQITEQSLRQVYATIFFLSALFFLCAIVAVKRKFVS